MNPGAKLLTFMALLFTPVATLAAVPNPPPMNNHPVVDAANIIPDADEAALTTKLLNIKARSHHEVAVLTVPSLGGYDIDEYSLNAARFYGLGSQDADDGVLVTVAPNEHKVRIEVGRGLTQMLTDGSSGLIIEEDMVPQFKAGDYVAGINAGVDDIAGKIVPMTPAQLMAKQRADAEAAARSQARWASFKDFMGYVFSMFILGGLGFVGYRTATAPRRKREREERERQEAEIRRDYEERQREVEAARARVAERARQAEAERQRKFQSWYDGLSPHERKAYDDEQRRKRLAAEEAEREAEEREEESSSSSYGSSYSSSSSSSSDYGSSSSSSSSDFGGGGGSFDGGGSSGSW
jgi:uncharacterized protein